MMFNVKFDLCGYHANWFVKLQREKKTLLWGVGNRCKDATYVLFLDYDENPLEWIHDEILLLQKRYTGLLGTAYLFATKHGTHVVFFEKHDLNTIYDMMQKTSCDNNYTTIPMHYGRRTWILRSASKKDEKITYIGCLHANKPSMNERSNAHRIYFQDLYPIPDNDFRDDEGVFDTEDHLTMAYYRIRE